MNKELLIIQIELQSLITQREAMVCENQTRISNGEALAYREEDFYEISKEILKLKDKLITK